jgi:hypothetical protein
MAQLTAHYRARMRRGCVTLFVTLGAIPHRCSKVGTRIESKPLLTGPNQLQQCPPPRPQFFQRPGHLTMCMIFAYAPKTVTENAPLATSRHLSPRLALSPPLCVPPAIKTCHLAFHRRLPPRSPSYQTDELRL